MRKYLIIGLLAAAASPLLAQPAPAPMAPMGMMVNKVVPRGEVLAMVQAHFARVDANRDGFVTEPEMTAMHRKMREMHRKMREMKMRHEGKKGKMGGGMKAGAMLKMADANRDGKVSLAEATTGALKHFDMMDANRDGRVTPEERAAGRARMMQMHKPG